MHRSKRITLLLCLLLVVCVATFAVTRMETHKEQIKAAGEVILEQAPEDMTALSWEYGEESLSFHRDEEGLWHWDEDDAFPVNEEAMAELLQWFSPLSSTFVISEVEDYSPYGLDDPACTITLTTDSGSHTITLGDFSQMDAQRYLSMGDGKAYLVAEDPMDAFQVTIRDLIQNDEVPQLTDVTGIAVSGPESYTISRQEDSGKSYSSDDLYFTEDRPLDTQRVESYLSKLESLNLTNYVTYNLSDEERAAYGMEAPELTVSVTYPGEAGEEAFTLHLSRDPEAVKEAEEAEEDTTIPCYARLGDSPIVYEISQSLYEDLTKAAYNDLRHQSLFWGDFTDVTEAVVTLEGSSYTLTTAVPEGAEPEDEDTHWYFEGKEVEIADFHSALNNLVADSFTEEKATGKEEISLTLRLNQEDFPEVSIQLYRYDGANCLAVVDGVPTALVKRVYMVDLIESVNAIVLNAPAQ